MEKHQGYNYEHCYAYDWNVMRGYHYLMRIGHLLNVLAALSVKIVMDLIVWLRYARPSQIIFLPTTISRDPSAAPLRPWNPPMRQRWPRDATFDPLLGIHYTVNRSVPQRIGAAKAL